MNSLTSLQLFFLLLNLLPLFFTFSNCHIPTTLEGPFLPVTVPFDTSLRGDTEDLPDDDPRVRRQVTGFQPEQISLSLSTTHHSVWLSWITGMSEHNNINLDDS
jgi:acid phosphatase type 7